MGHPMKFNGMKPFLIIKLTMKLCEGNMVMDQPISFQKSIKNVTAKVQLILQTKQPIKICSREYLFCDI